MIVIESKTSRLRLRGLRDADTAFVLDLLNDPAFLRHVGDRGLRTLDDTRAYLDTAAQTVAGVPGLGSYLVERKGDGAAMGICTLLRRQRLEDVDLGYTLAPDFRGAGYAEEACRLLMTYARVHTTLRRMVAIVSPGNEASLRLLGKLGFAFERHVRLDEDSGELCLYATALAADTA